MRQFKNQKRIHKPVLVKEVIDVLGLTSAHLKKPLVVDATVGSGGHSEAFIKMGAFVIGIDADKKILNFAKDNLEKVQLRQGYVGQACPARYRLVPGSAPSLTRGCFKLIHGNFRKIDELIKNAGFEKVDAILFDLGISSIHFESEKRGFSFKDANTPLDMRIDVDTQKVTAADLLNSLPKSKLRELFEVVMTKRDAVKIAEEVVLVRKIFPIRTVGDFYKISEKLFKKRGKLHPATKPFLALRMATNSELENLKEALPKAFNLLEKNGRMAVISFHSGEDAIVKSFFKDLERKRSAQILTKKPVIPGVEEIKKNPKARSAKMRAILKKL